MEHDPQRPDDTTERGHIKDLGIINIKFRRRNIVDKCSAKSWESDKSLSSASVLTEKQLKGKSVTHGVAYVSLFYRGCA